jgi:DNA-binding transcriptional ArsR family regulator
VDLVFHALSHPARRRIVSRLAAGPATVGEVAEPLEMSPPAVTKHLKVLEGAGLVDRRIEGRNHHLTLVREPLQGAGSWIEGIESFWERSLDALAARVEGGRP